jgi:hypothetical protein
VEEKGVGWWEEVDRFTVEADGAEKPVRVVESFGRMLLRAYALLLTGRGVRPRTRLDVQAPCPP